MKGTKHILLFLMLVAAVVTIFPQMVRADTNGSEIQITDQPDKLVLQLGQQWAGVEFELKTDAGVFPVPVVVDEAGILKMDLGGSKTYTLSCVASTVTIPGPENMEIQATSPAAAQESPNATGAGPNQPQAGIPTGVLVMFIVGLIGAVGGLLAMWYFKYRRDVRAYDDDYEDDCE